MKKLLIIILAIFGLLSVTPLVFSIKANEAYETLVNQANKNGALILKPDHYKKGYLSSAASATVKINWDEILGDRSEIISEPLRNLNFKVSHQILHGPFPKIMDGNFKTAQALIITTLDLSKDSKNKINGLFPDGHPVIFHSWVELSGDNQTIISANSFDTKNNRDSLIWQGLEGSIHYFVNQSRLQTRIDIPLFQHQDQQGGTFSMSGLHTDSDILQDESGVNIGNMNASLNKLTLSNTRQNNETLNLNVKELKATSQTRISNNKLNSRAIFSIKHLTINNSQFGPAGYDLSISNIDTNTIKLSRAEIEKLNRADMPAEQKKALITAKMLSLLPDILSHSPQLDIKQISFYFGGEQFELNAMIHINPDLVKKDMPPIMLLQALDIEANITVPKSLIAALPKPKSRLKLSTDNTVIQTPSEPSASQRLERLTQQGYFNTDGRYYRSRIIFRLGKLTLNDLPLNPLQVIK